MSHCCAGCAVGLQSWLLQIQLSSAMRSGNEQRLARVLLQAEHIGIPWREREDAQREPDRLRAFSQLSEHLHRSMDVDSIEAACNRLRVAGLDHSPGFRDLFQQGQSHVQQMLRSELCRALQSRDVEAILQACHHVARLACSQETTAVAARSWVHNRCAEPALLHLLEAARSWVDRWCAEMDLLHLLEVEDPTKLREACKVAANAGVAQGMIENAQLTVRRLEAHAELVRAVQGGRVQQIENACNQPKSEGVSDSLLASSHEKLCRLSEEALQKAVEDADVSMIGTCCERAARVGLCDHKIRQGYQEIRRLQKIQHVKAVLKQAVQSGDAYTILEACEQAANILDSECIRDARSVAFSLMINDVSKATCSGIAADIERACLGAARLCVRCSDVQPKDVACCIQTGLKKACELSGLELEAAMHEEDPTFCHP